MKASENNGQVVITEITDFNPVHIFECGQAFRWNWDGTGYIGVVKDKVVKIYYTDQKLVIDNCCIEEYNSVWKRYFDMERDYGKIKEFLSNDNVLKNAIKHGWGIRILNQDSWETLVSFIISANNGIKRIKGIIENLSRAYGKEIKYNTNTFYTFPDAKTLSSVDLDELYKYGCGYRAPYIKKTSQVISEGLLSLYEISQMSYECAHRELLKFPGVGPKVADCILLFSMEKPEAFPVDVWVNRVMRFFYLDKSVTSKYIKEVASKKFGPFQGIAQQYLFYYARELKIGL